MRYAQSCTAVCTCGTYRVVATDNIPQGNHARVEIIAYLQRDLVPNVGYSSSRLTPAGVASRFENHRVRALLGNRDYMGIDACALGTRHGAVVGRLGNEVALEIKDLPGSSRE